jgi:myo-inositol 2-dehydrogenase/D-chiro-inositol 1-dehydrogenase
MSAPTSHPTRIALIGAGRMGSFHAESLARRVPEAELAVIADPAAGAAERLAAAVGCPRWVTDPIEAIADPQIDAVVIVAPARLHSGLVVAAARAGKAVFCEKPMALTLEEADRAIVAARNAGVVLQVGFNRRFAADFRAAHGVVAAGGIGTPQLLRSVTRDPGLAGPGAVPPWTIFRETLIHDFDALLWLNPGARPVEVYAMADALVAPDYKVSGLLDTSVVVIRFDNGAIATAEANFSAAYGYDVRGEVFGSAGMVTAGSQASTAMRHYTSTGVRQETVRGDAARFRDAYTTELASFVAAVRAGSTPEVTGEDARAALAVALAAVESVKGNRPVRVSEVDAP